MEQGRRALVVGADTKLGNALVRRLTERAMDAVLTDRDHDLRSASGATALMAWAKPDIIYFAAGRSGGIAANAEAPADLMIDNLRVVTFGLTAAWEAGVTRLLYLGSSCVYPKHCALPVTEATLYGGPLEPTSAAYATARIAGIALCRALSQQHGIHYIPAIPPDVFGPTPSHATFDPHRAHVVDALIHRFETARTTGSPVATVWGTGEPRRQLAYVDDVAEACIHVMDHAHDGDLINLGIGTDVSIRALAALIRELVGYPGDVVFDRSRPDGHPQRILDGTKLVELGFRPRVTLREGLAATVRAYRARSGGTPR